jgi:hypothetical protein|tara:strand:+ start:91 stop:387 length:297 start_codon:yes stop_codon:yes gene_type:complete
MPEYDHDAIRKAYPLAVTIDDDQDPGVFDANGNSLSIDQSLVDAARVELDKLSYQYDRSQAYPSIKEQMDMQYWDSVNGTTTWKDAIAKVKADNPKPS